MVKLPGRVLLPATFQEAPNAATWRVSCKRQQARDCVFCVNMSSTPVWNGKVTVAKTDAWAHTAQADFDTPQ